MTLVQAIPTFRNEGIREGFHFLPKEKLARQYGLQRPPQIQESPRYLDEKVFLAHAARSQTPKRERAG